MENKVLNENISHIAKYNKRLADEILRFNCEKSSFELVKMPNDEFNILSNGNLIHDIQGAKDEAKRIVNSIKNKEDKNIIRIIYGFGLGYLLDEAAGVLEGKIVVYEPDLCLLKFVFSLAKIDGLFKNNVFLCSDKESLIEYISALSDEKTDISITFLNYHKQNYLNDIKDVLYTAQKAQAQHKGNRMTMCKKMPQAIINTFSNFKKILTTPNVMSLKDTYKGKTALCVSAGPSLTENIEIIKKNQDKFVIFALNPTIKLLAKHNIQPDFILYIETIDNKAQFNYDIVENSYLILEPYCYREIYNLKSKGIFNYISKESFLNSWILDCLKINSNLSTVGTVSYTALMSAYMMGFEKIILIGQDLAYKDGHCYSKGSHYENLRCVFKKELNKYVIEPDDMEKFENAISKLKDSKETIEKNAKAYLNYLNNNIATVKAQDGSLLPTQTGYAIFVDIFAQLAKSLKQANPQLKLINSSKGGAQIDNFENIALEEAVENLNFVKKKEFEIKPPVIDKKHIEKNIQIMKNNLKSFRDYILQIKNNIDELYKELNQNLEFSEKVLTLLKKQNEIFKKFQFLPDDKYLNIITRSVEDRFILYFNENYLKNPKICLSKNICALRFAKEMLDILDESIQKLADCELFILQ